MRAAAVRTAPLGSQGAHTLDSLPCVSQVNALDRGETLPYGAMRGAQFRLIVRLARAGDDGVIAKNSSRGPGAARETARWRQLLMRLSQVGARRLTLLIFEYLIGDLITLPYMQAALEGWGCAPTGAADPRRPGRRCTFQTALLARHVTRTSRLLPAPLFFSHAYAAFGSTVIFT